MAGRNASAIVIAELLSTEGFNEHTSSMITKYALHQATQGQRHRFRKFKRMFSAMVKEKLTDADRLILGKFMAVKFKMHMDTGLRMGLTAYLRMSDEDREKFRLAVFMEDGQIDQPQLADAKAEKQTA
jgi:hypothetical protein